MSRIPFRFAPIPDDMLFDPEMSPHVVVLWAAVYRLTDRKGVAAIGQTELGEALGWSVATVRRHVRAAEACGAIATKRRGKMLPNEYTAILRDRSEASDQERSELSDHPDGSERSQIDRSLISSRERSTRDTRVSTRSDLPGFDDLWRIYPRKTDKGRARAAYAKALRIASAEEIYAGLERSLPALRRADPQFVPYLATWLNGERWTDELGAAVKTSQWLAECDVCRVPTGEPSADFVCFQDKCPYMKAAADA